MTRRAGLISLKTKQVRQTDRSEQEGELMNVGDDDMVTRAYLIVVS